jgi:hypothetical protein
MVTTPFIGLVLVELKWAHPVTEFGSTSLYQRNGLVTAGLTLPPQAGQILLGGKTPCGL